MSDKTKKNSGFTFIELIITLAIISILFGSALPDFSDFLDRRKIEAASMQLRNVLQLARKSAVTENQRVTVCPTNDSVSCSDNWSHGYVAFVDLNQDRELDSDEVVLYQNKISDPEMKVRWRAFGRQDSMQWHETGITNHQNGSFELCLRQKPEMARALIIAKAGRIRSSIDSDGNGIHENSRGDSLDCW